MYIKNDSCGHFELTLEQYLQEHNISKNKLSEKADLQRTQLNAYCSKKVQRLDLKVMARICTALECGISDIIGYIKPSENDIQKG